MRQVFVGREAELEALTRLLDDVVTGRGRLALVLGEPGIGKTRLAEELATRAEAHGMRVVWGRAWEGGGTPPFWPWRQALRRLLSRTDDLPPAIHGLLSDRAAAGDGGAEPATFALYEAASEALQRATAARPALLVLDDMHVADVSSLELLHFVARDLRDARLLVLVTSRELSLYATGEASAILAKAAREAVIVPLARLQRGDLVRWIDSAAPSLANDIDTLLTRSDGNPLFVRELIAATAGRSPGALSASLPTGIREAIREHLALVAPETRTLLETASVLGRETTRSAIASIAGPATDLGPLLEDATTKGIVVEDDAATLRFTHVLLRDELYASLPTARRAELHRRAWATATDAAAALHHALESARPEDADELARTALSAVTDAIAQHAFDEAAAMGIRALARLGEGGAPGALVELECAVGDALMFAGRREEAMVHCTRAADLAERSGDAERLARAALSAAYEPGMTPRPEVTRLLRRAEAALPPGDSPLRAIVLGRLARALLPPAPHELEEYRRLRALSVEMARRVGSREDVLDALRLATEGFQNLMSMEEQYALNAETIALAEELGRLASIVPLLPHQVACCLQRGDPGEAERELARAESILARFRQPSYQWRAPLMRALVLILRGDFEQADALQRRALRAAEDAGDRQGILLFTIQRGMLHYVRGDADGIDEFAALTAQVQSAVPLTSLFAALEHAVAGRRDEARACLSRLDPKTIDGIPGVGTLGWACAEAELAELAPTFIPLVERDVAQAPFSFGPAALVTTGPVELLLGRLLLLAGRIDEAETRLRSARAFCEKVGARPCIVRADLALAEIAQRRSAPDTAALASAVRDAARALGMRKIAERAEALLHDAPRASSPPVRELTLQLTRQGPIWHLDAGPTRVVLKDMRGVAYLDELLRRPHREVHVLELAGQDESGDAGPLLDGAAKSAYRERIASIRVEIDQATSDNDPGRVDRLRAELEAITGELLRAVGLHGKDRLAGSRAERARSSVQRRLRDVVKRVAEQAPALGRHLELSVKTGTFCMYAPTWPADASE